MKRYSVSSVIRKIQNKISEILKWLIFLKNTIPSVRMQSNTQTFCELLVKMQKKNYSHVRQGIGTHKKDRKEVKLSL